MKKALLGVLLLGLLVAADEKKPDDPKTNIKGTWKFESVTDNGTKLDADQIKDWSLTFEGEKLTFKQGNDTKGGKFKVDATQKPPHLDVTPDDGKDKTMKAIYTIDGDTIKIAVNPEGDRPKSFDDAAIVIVAKREKK
jgi:uncharacterized protein (TIGR03067 family)